MTVLKVSKLTKIFTPIRGSNGTGTMAVNELSFDLNGGEIISMLGPNGSGKTTTIKMLAGLYVPSSGTATICGYDLQIESEKARAATGYVPDEPLVYEKMSGREFLGFVGSLYSMTKSEAHKESGRYLELFPELIEQIDGYVEQYSRGSKQKLAMIAAFMHRPKLLLIDEPMVGLDPQSALTVKSLLKKFRSEGGSVLLSTHTLPVAEDLSDRIILLSKGNCVAFGSIMELRSAYSKYSASLEEIYMGLSSKEKSSQ